MSAADLVQSRKWLVTINNPAEHCLSHDAIKQIMSAVRGESLYWCMCDEQGDECETLHTHVFIYRASAFTAAQIGNLFPSCHRDKAFGTAEENRAYVHKMGDKFNRSDDGSYSYTDANGHLHAGINFGDTFEEFGTVPVEHQGKSSASELIVSLIQDGASNREIVDTVSSAYKDIDKIERVRSMYRDSDFASKWRNMEVTYVFGKTGSGKTRGVMDKYGYLNCYRVTDYKHPFDTYDGQDVIIFEEFRGGIRHGDMLNYLDGYPLLLPCRYFNRQACFTKVYIISNIPPDSQYTNVDPESLKAFYRRINKVVWHDDTGHIAEYDGVQAYLDRYKWADAIANQEAIPMPRFSHSRY